MKQQLLLTSDAAAALAPDEQAAAFPVYLNVYDLTPFNSAAYWFGLGIYHSGVQVHGIEYAFGFHFESSSGVFEVEPRQCPGFTFRRSIQVGTTDLGPLQARELVESVTADYNGDTYHILLKNCNHFTDDVVYRLTNQRIPGWVNRLARLAWISRCCLPDFLQGNVAEHLSELERSEDESTAGKDTAEVSEDVLLQQQQQQRQLLLPDGSSKAVGSDPPNNKRLSESASASPFEFRGVTVLQRAVCD